MSDAEDNFHHRGDEQHLLREIMRTHQVLMACFTRAMGRPASHLALMRVLALAESGLGIMAIAEALDVNAAAVTRIVNDMEVEKLIRRRPDARDKRRHYVCLTDKGTKLFREIHARSHDLENRLVASIGANELDAAAAVLAKLRNVVEDINGHR